MLAAVFGVGPLPEEPRLPVTAGGLRTWQIVRTAALGLGAAQSDEPREIVVLGLETSVNGREKLRLDRTLQAEGHEVRILYHAINPDTYALLGTGRSDMNDYLPAQPAAVVSSGPPAVCAAAARYAVQTRIPLWTDLPSDPFLSIQNVGTAAPRPGGLVETWQELLPVLLETAHFSTLTARGRLALIGQLGQTGRLNRMTSQHDLVTKIPFAAFEEDHPTSVPVPEKANFVVLALGSWGRLINLEAVTNALQQALTSCPRLRVLCIASNEEELIAGPMKELAGRPGLSEAIQMVPPRSYEELRKLCGLCDAGLLIEDDSYDSLMREPVQHWDLLAAGKPLIVSGKSEFASEIVELGAGIPFDQNVPETLAQTLIGAATSPSDLLASGEKAREWATRHRDARTAGTELVRWLQAPTFAPDEAAQLDPENNGLLAFWKTVTQG